MYRNIITFLISSVLVGCAHQSTIPVPEQGHEKEAQSRANMEANEKLIAQTLAEEEARTKAMDEARAKADASLEKEKELRTKVSASLFLRNPTGSEKSKIIAAVKETLIDPYSAKFGKITILSSKQSKTADFACVTFNSKNRFGGYVGTRQIEVMRLDDEWSTIKVVNVPHDDCINEWH